MKFEHLLGRLHASKAYEEFEKKYKNSFVVAGFFVLDLESKQNLEQIDYYVPSENKIAAFTLGGPISMQLLEMVKSDAKPQPLNVETSTDIDSLAGILDDEMKNRGISEKIKKIVAILHVIEGKPTWNLSCILSGMGVLKAHVEDSSQTVLKMEKSNLLDIMKKMPVSQFKQMQQTAGQTEQTLQQVPQAGKQAVQPSEKQMADAVDTEIKKLDAIEVQIEKQKVLLKEEFEKEKADAKKAVKSVKPVKQANKK